MVRRGHRGFQGHRKIIARDASDYAEYLSQLIFDRLDLLADYPKMDRRVPESGDEGDREIIVEKYRIFYQLLEGEDALEISTNIHGSRDFRRKYLLFSRGIHYGGSPST